MPYDGMHAVPLLRLMYYKLLWPRTHVCLLQKTCTLYVHDVDFELLGRSREFRVATPMLHVRTHSAWNSSRVDISRIHPRCPTPMRPAHSLVLHSISHVSKLSHLHVHHHLHKSTDFKSTAMLAVKTLQRTLRAL